MISLQEADRHTLEQFCLRIQDIQNKRQLEDFTINIIPPFLGAEFASWNEHDEAMFLTRVATSTSHSHLVKPLIGALNQTLPTHPLFPKYLDLSTGKVRYVDTVDRTRDHIDDDSYRALPFYLRVASRLRIEDQLLMHIFVEESAGILVTFHSSRKFTRRQQLLATILRSHLVTRLYAIQRQSQKRSQLAGEISSHLTSRLTPREIEILRLICRGHGNQEIAQSLEISKRTADKHASNILRKLNASSRFQIIARFGHWLQAP
ncbi:helix-turn-helix transcriptional regulator [Akkermansiaceae bacterium]|nr:helix-turn-helix transcriptional regulator [Akkermansiaceae bacterium]